jgi:asparagine synthase (glutamine-hydrolysing)
MCGIVGIVSNKNISAWGDKIKKMNDVQAHRGPDGEGFWTSAQGNVLFGHRRLSIIDLSDAGAQPLHSADGRFVIVFNGEIYNYRELREACEQKGSRFHSHTDTEVIIEYLRHFGVKGIQDLRGMWAFVLYDTQANKILISRDPFGIKPLHYGIKDDCLYFASEIKSLRLTEPFFNIPDETTKQVFLDFGYLDVGNWTFFENVRRFPAASYAEIDLGKEGIEIKPVTFWQPPIPTTYTDEKQAIDKLDQLLDRSIERHMVSDVPLAFCLSGGLDSSLTVGIASQKATEGQALNTFTTYYPDFPEINERKWAEMAVAHCKTQPHWITPQFEEFKDEFDLVLYHHDEPFGSTSVYAQNAIFKSIGKAGVKVSLDGQGADEIFGGYHSYHYFFLKCLLHQKKYGTLLYEAICLFVKSPRFLFDNYGYIIRIFNRQRQAGVAYSPQYEERVSSVKSRKAKDFSSHLLGALMYTSLPQLLRNGDRNSMKSGVESRVPYLDVDLVNFALSLPNDLKIRHAVTKYILRQVAYRYLPRELVDRRDKLGFPAPEKQWLMQAFNLPVARAFSKEWRNFIVQRWEQMIHA